MSYIIQTDFLPRYQLQALRGLVAAKQKFFDDRSIDTEFYPDYRRAKILFDRDFPDFYQEFTARLRECLPAVQDSLERQFPVGNIELQITASGDGHFYKVHTDNSSEETKQRRLSFVYYFLMTKQQEFTGGDLRLEDRLISPTPNSIVWFPSELLHQVLPVKQPSQWFLASRFTCNGWVHIDSAYQALGTTMGRKLL